MTYEPLSKLMTHEPVPVIKNMMSFNCARIWRPLSACTRCNLILIHCCNGDGKICWCVQAVMVVSSLGHLITIYCLPLSEGEGVVLVSSEPPLVQQMPLLVTLMSTVHHCLNTNLGRAVSKLHPRTRWGNNLQLKFRDMSPSMHYLGKAKPYSAGKRQ